MHKSTALYVRDTLRTSILRHSQRGERLNANMKTRFQTAILKEVEACQPNLERLQSVGLRGFQPDASAAEELQSMRVLFTYLTKVIEGEEVQDGTSS